MAYQIRKYSNRKYYDPQQSRMINLADITKLVQDGEEIEVVLNKTGEEITNITLAQALLETEKEGSPTLGVIRALVRSQKRLARGILQAVLFMILDANGLGGAAPFDGVIRGFVARELLSPNEAESLRAQVRGKLRRNARALEALVEKKTREALEEKKAPRRPRTGTGGTAATARAVEGRPGKPVPAAGKRLKKSPPKS